MRCPSCMAENAATRRFCARCGAALPSPCANCGFENEPAAAFCGGCGKPVGVAVAPVAAASPAPRTDSAERRQLTGPAVDWLNQVYAETRGRPSIQWAGPPQARGFGGVLPYRADQTVRATAIRRPYRLNFGPPNGRNRRSAAGR
jgi:hypothetical protein